MNVNILNIFYNKIIQKPNTNPTQHANKNANVIIRRSEKSIKINYNKRFHTHIHMS